MENWKMLLLMLLLFVLAACSSQEEEETGTIMAMSPAQFIAYQSVHIMDYEETLNVLLEHVDIEQVCSSYQARASSKSEQGLPVRLEIPRRLAEECFPQRPLLSMTGEEGKIAWVEIQ